MVPEIRYLKSLEAIPQHVNHTLDRSKSREAPRRWQQISDTHIPGPHNGHTPAITTEIGCLSSPLVMDLGLGVIKDWSKSAGWACSTVICARRRASNSFLSKSASDLKSSKCSNPARPARHLSQFQLLTWVGGWVIKFQFRSNLWFDSIRC